MTDEKTTTDTTDMTAADPPPAPNGHGAGSDAQNGAPHGVASKDAPVTSSKKKKKKKHPHQHDETSTSAPVESTAAVTTDQPVPVESTEAPAVLTPAEEPVAATKADEVAAEATNEPVERLFVGDGEGLRVRMKVWTDAETSARYLVPSAFMRDVVNGHPISDVMYAYAIGEDEVKQVTLTASEWQALPFFYFQEDGPAPATTRQVSSIRFQNP